MSSRRSSDLRFDRRRFIIGSAAAVRTASLLELDACGVDQLQTVPPSGRAYTLTVGYATTRFPGGYTLRTRTYNGRTVGPMLEATPGTTLSVRVINTLPPNPPVTIPRGTVRIPQARGMSTMRAPAGATVAAPASGLNVMINPQAFNTTNLHVHGLQTIPHLLSRSARRIRRR